MRKDNNNNSFWPSYVDVMTTLFAIMLVLFAVTYTRFNPTCSHPTTES